MERGVSLPYPEPLDESAMLCSLNNFRNNRSNSHVVTAFSNSLHSIPLLTHSDQQILRQELFAANLLARSVAVASPKLVGRLRGSSL